MRKIKVENGTTQDQKGRGSQRRSRRVTIKREPSPIPFFFDYARIDRGLLSLETTYFKKRCPVGTCKYLEFFSDEGLKQHVLQCHYNERIIKKKNTCTRCKLFISSRHKFDTHNRTCKVRFPHVEESDSDSDEEEEQPEPSALSMRLSRRRRRLPNAELAAKRGKFRDDELPLLEKVVEKVKNARQNLEEASNKLIEMLNESSEIYKEKVQKLIFPPKHVAIKQEDVIGGICSTDLSPSIRQFFNSWMQKEGQPLLRVKVERPELSRVKVETPKPSRVKVEPPKPSRVKVEPPKLSRVKVEPPELSRVKVEPPKLSRVKVEPPELSRVKVEPPKLSRVKVEPPELPRVKVEPPKLSRVKVEPPKLSRVKVEPPKLSRVKVETPELFRVKVETQELSLVKVETPKLSRVKVETPKLSRVKVETPELFRVKVEPPGLFRVKVEPPDIIAISTEEEEVTIIGSTSNKRDMKRRVFHCELCSYATKEQGNYKRHIGIHVKKEIKKEIEPQKSRRVRKTEKPLLQCKHCAFSSRETGNFSRHMSIHGIPERNSVRYQCKMCDFSAKGYNEMNFHTLRLHNVNSMHECDFCDKEFVSSVQLKEHRYEHAVPFPQNKLSPGTLTRRSLRTL